MRIQKTREGGERERSGEGDSAGRDKQTTSKPIGTQESPKLTQAVGYIYFG